MPLPNARRPATAAPSPAPGAPAADAATARLWLLVSLGGLLLLGLWDASGLDLPLAHWFGDASGFALREHWLLKNVLHDGVRDVAWGITALLALMVVWPRGVLRRLTRGERAGLLAGVLAALFVVLLIKRLSLTSCPWDLQVFGGLAQHVSHWRWGVADGGEGHCFPAGHASAALAYVAPWFWLRAAAPRAANTWLATALLLGLVLGAVQQVRGAHYMSHTGWTAWLCWTVGGALWWLARGRRRAGPAAARAG